MDPSPWWMPAVIVGIVDAADTTLQGMDATKRVLTWWGTSLAAAFLLGVTLIGWVGLPQDVSQNSDAVGTLAENQRAIVRLMVDNRCQREELSTYQCTELKREYLSRLEYTGSSGGE